jgi:uncharacterized coiled-coil protein SlyX
MRITFILLAAAAACGSPKPDPAPAPAAAAPPAARPVQTRTVRETVTVRDPDLERRLGRLELRVLEKETQVDQLETRLEDARDEVVRTMAKLETLNSRAEAASGMAEADVALQALRSGGGSQTPELNQATRLARLSNAEFEKRNFGGALYLAHQARALAMAGRARLAGNRGAPRPGETAFAVPVRLKVTSRGNVREGPATSFAVTFAVESGMALTGLSYTDEWVRVVDDGGRSGWIFRSLVARP